VSGNSFLGSTGHWPVPPGDPPGGTRMAPAANKHWPIGRDRLGLPFGESPTGTGGSPVLPIFRRRAERLAQPMFACASGLAGFCSDSRGFGPPVADMNADRDSVGEMPTGATESPKIFGPLPQGTGPEGFRQFARKVLDSPIPLWYESGSDANHPNAGAARGHRGCCAGTPEIAKCTK
jgi:hypothetical protein